MTTPRRNSDDKSCEDDDNDNNNGKLDLLQNSSATDSSYKPMITPGANSNDESSGLDKRVRTQDLLLNIGAADPSGELPRTILGANSSDRSSGFNNSVLTQNLPHNFGAMAASHEPSLELMLAPPGNEPSSATRTGKRKRGPSLELMLAPPGNEPSSTTRTGKRKRRPSLELMLAPPGNEPSSTTRTGKRKRGSRLELMLTPPGIKKTKDKFYKSKLPPLPSPPLDLPPDFRRHIDLVCGQEVKLVMQKVLTCSDLSSHLARLMLPENQIMRGVTFLRTGEYDELHTNKDKEIAVGVISSKLEEKLLKFKLWSMDKKARVVGQSKPDPTNVYVLLGGWVGFARDNELEANDRVQLWSFRINDKTHHDSLKFAIVKLKGNDKDRDGDDTE